MIIVLIKDVNPNVEKNVEKIDFPELTRESGPRADRRLADDREGRWRA